MNKLTIATITALFGLLFLAAPAHAVADTSAVDRTAEKKALLQQKKDEIGKKTEDAKAWAEQMKEQYQEKAATRVSEMKKLMGKRTVLPNAQVTAVAAGSLTVVKEGKTYQINITGNTRLVRRFFGKSEMSEIAVGHIVSVVGKWADEEQTAIDAYLIRDLSIQKRFGAFVGTVKSISGNTISLETMSRGTQTVTVDSSTKYVNRMNVAITLSDIALEHRIRVKGMWDRSVNSITEVTQVKDYSIPEMPLGSGLIKATPSATLTPQTTQ